jgi:hypothetical protein
VVAPNIHKTMTIICVVRLEVSFLIDASGTHFAVKDIGLETSVNAGQGLSSRDEWDILERKAVPGYAGIVCRPGVF